MASEIYGGDITPLVLPPAFEVYRATVRTMVRCTQAGGALGISLYPTSGMSGNSPIFTIAATSVIFLEPGQVLYYWILGAGLYPNLLFCPVE